MTTAKTETGVEAKWKGAFNQPLIVVAGRKPWRLASADVEGGSAGTGRMRVVVASVPGSAPGWVRTRTPVGQAQPYFSRGLTTSSTRSCAHVYPYSYLLLAVLVSSLFIVTGGSISPNVYPKSRQMEYNIGRVRSIYNAQEKFRQPVVFVHQPQSPRSSFHQFSVSSESTTANSVQGIPDGTTLKRLPMSRWRRCLGRWRRTLRSPPAKDRHTCPRNRDNSQRSAQSRSCHCLQIVAQ